MAPARAEPVFGRKLDVSQMRMYAQYQITQVDTVLAKHSPAAGSSCRCGRPAPCPQQQSLAATRARYEGTLALLDQTQALPVIAPLPPQRRSPWQWLTTLVREVL